MFLLKIVAVLVILASAELCSGFYTSNRVNLKGRFTSKLFMSSKYLGTEPVFVAGGSSGVGLEVIRKLSALGTPVRALVRREESRVLLQKVPGVTVVLGDALDESAVQNCMAGCVAAITTLGGSPSDGQLARVDYEGNSNVIEQAGILGVERIVLVTRYVSHRHNIIPISYNALNALLFDPLTLYSVGCGDTAGAIAVPVYKALETFLVAKTRAERDLKRYTNLVSVIIVILNLSTKYMYAI